MVGELRNDYARASSRRVNSSGLAFALLPPRVGAQRIERKSLIEDLGGRFRARDRQLRGVEDPELCQHRRLIPVEMLLAQLVATELHDRDHRNAYFFAGRLDARQQGVVPLVVLEAG